MWTSTALVAVCGRTCWDGLWRTQSRGDFSGHESLFQEWSAPLNGAVLGVRRHSKATLLEHQRLKTPGISYDEVSPARQEAC